MITGDLFSLTRGSLFDMQRLDVSASIKITVEPVMTHLMNCAGQS